jgi:opacity protein-like surface antigen
MSRTLTAAFAALLLLPSPAAADITAFLGSNVTPSNRLVRGFAGGFSLLIVGFEFEYAQAGDDVEEGAPALRTIMVNGLLQTPGDLGGFQLYGTAGGGVYRERLGPLSETHVGVNVGGGVKMTLAGPLRLRLDYRVFTLRGRPLHPRPQRFYAGLNLRF